MNRYKLVIFDLDGTLLDTSPGVLEAVKITIAQLNLPMPERDILDSFIGPPMQLTMQRVFGMNAKDALFNANIFRENYKQYSLLKAKLYPNVLSTLESLRQSGYKIAVATNKSHENAIHILNHYGIASLCDFMMGSDLEGKLKKTDIIRKCMKIFQLKSDEAVYVGDSYFDLNGARDNGIDFIGVVYGFEFTDATKICYPLIKRFDQLLEML